MSNEQYRPSGFSFLPQVVKNLLIINAIGFFAFKVLENQGVDLNDLLGLHYFQSEKFRVYQIITYMFMHGNFPHILLNMFALWMFGTPVENQLGKQRFLQYYLLTGLGAAVTHYAIVYFQLNPTLMEIDQYVSSQSLSVAELKRIEMDRTLLLNAPLIVGASGAVFGILLAFGYMFPNTLLFIIPIPFPIKAKYAVIGYGLIELFSGIADIQGDNVAHWAHLGGLLFGFILLRYWQRPRSRYP